MEHITVANPSPSSLPTSLEVKEEKKEVKTVVQETSPQVQENSTTYEHFENTENRTTPEGYQQEKKQEVPLELPTPAISTSLEEKRKALLDKSKKKISGFSIQGIEEKNTHIAQQKYKKAAHHQLPEEAFTQEQLSLVWAKYVDQLKEKGQLILASIINADQPVLKGTTVMLRFPNKSMKEDLEKSQGQILEYLKRELNNYLIDFEIAVDKSITKKYVYTDQDKFTKLVEKNPAIDLLRRTFDLDF